MKEIAVIIPVYKAHDTIKQTLMSIGMQKAVDYRVYLVVDGEEEGSYDYLDNYLGLDTEIHYMEVNGGPGVARQWGIDHSTEPFISFIDADDVYNNSLSLYYQHHPFAQGDCALVATDFLQEYHSHQLKLQERNMVWMHGKMYRRAFIDKYDIRFNDTRANEDVGFNTQCQCYTNNEEKVYFSDHITYLWQWRDDSITRDNDNAYTLGLGVDGLVTNTIYAFERVLAKNEINHAIMEYIMSGLVHLYQKYSYAKKEAPKQVKHINKWAKKYLFKLYKHIDKDYMAEVEPLILSNAGFVDGYKIYTDWKGELRNGRKDSK